MSWIANAWDWLFALTSGAWAATASWVAVAVGIGTVVVTFRYARKQIEQAKAQLMEAESARLAQAAAADQARIDADLARLEQAREAERIRTQQAEEAQRIREEQAQPNVVMFTESNSTHWNYLELVVKNFGNTPAYNVTLAFDPEPVVAPYKNQATGEQITHLAYPSEIPFLAPGQEWRTLWDSAQRRSEHTGPLQARFETKVSYTDERQKAFETKAILDWDTLTPMTRVTTKTIHHVATALKDGLTAANTTLTKISTQLDNLDDPNHGVFAYTGDAILDELQRRQAETAESYRVVQGLIEQMTGQPAESTPPTEAGTAPRSSPEPPADPSEPPVPQDG